MIEDRKKREEREITFRFVGLTHSFLFYKKKFTHWKQNHLKMTRHLFSTNLYIWTFDCQSYDGIYRMMSCCLKKIDNCSYSKIWSECQKNLSRTPTKQNYVLFSNNTSPIIGFVKNHWNNQPLKFISIWTSINSMTSECKLKVKQTSL